MRVLVGLVIALLGLETQAAERNSGRPPKRALRAGWPKAPKAKKAVRLGEARGRVSSVTVDAIFLDRGTADGLAVKQLITFTRNGKPTSKCLVEAASEHFARCVGTGLRAGDRFSVTRADGTSPPAPAPLPTEAELMRRAAMVNAAGWLLRDFDTAARTSGAGPRVEVLLSHTTYGNPRSVKGPFGVQRLDVAVYDVELWKGLRASVDLSALNFSARPTTTRMVYQQSPVLLVHQLELGFRRADVPFSASVGRTWLRLATGLLVVDGAQAGWRLGTSGEVGAYGGLLPDAARLTIMPSQWTAGAFARVRFSSGTGEATTLVQLAARAGWSLREVLGGRAEVGLAASVWNGQRFDGHASFEFGFGATQAPAGLDAARVDLGWKPSETLRVSGAFRYRGLPTTGLTEVGTVSPGQRALHSDLALGWQATDWLSMAAQAGLATDFDSGLLQVRVGPEVAVSRGVVGVGVGYMEELGWLRGRHAYVQLSVAPQGFFRVLTRASWFQQQASAASLGMAGDELGASAALEVTPWRYLKARVLVMGRLPLGAQATPLGSVGVQLGGAF